MYEILEDPDGKLKKKKVLKVKIELCPELQL